MTSSAQLGPCVDVMISLAHPHQQRVMPWFSNTKNAVGGFLFFPQFQWHRCALQGHEGLQGGVLNIRGATSAHRTAQPIRLEKSITESNLWPNTAMALSATSNISRDGDSNTFLGSPFQHLITLPVGSITPKFPLMSIPNHLGCLCPHQSMARGSAPILGCWASKQLVAYA